MKEKNKNIRKNQKTKIFCENGQQNIKKNIANEMNFKYKISEGIRKYCRGGK